MKTRRFDGSEIRLILIGMITNQTILSRISGQWRGEGLFDSKWANLIGGWCVKYFSKYQKPPVGRIQTIFEMWSTKNTTDEKTSQAIEHFLLSLSDEHSDDVPEHVLDIAGGYFKKVRLKQEMDAALIEIDNGMIDQAEERLDRRQRVNLGVGSFVNASGDFDAWMRASNQEYVKPLVQYPGDFGKFTERAFSRGSLWAFLAPDKTGKTTYLLDFAYRAVRQRNRVAYFDCGDSNEEEVLLKLKFRAASRPEFDSRLKVPIEWDDKGTLIHSTIEYQAAEVFEAYKSFRKICKNDDVFRVSCHLNSTATVQDLDNVLAGWDREGWRPDVVVMDYADILARPRGIIDKIEAIDENWKGLRKMSQQRHALVITATQTKSTGYVKRNSLLGPEDFSGSKTKNAHVNGILGINISAEEKQTQSARINWTVRRKGENHPRAFCRVAGCIAFGNPIIVSKLG